MGIPQGSCKNRRYVVSFVFLQTVNIPTSIKHKKKSKFDMDWYYEAARVTRTCRVFSD